MQRLRAVRAAGGGGSSDGDEQRTRLRQTIWAAGGENAVAARNEWRTRRGGYADGVDFSGRACVNHRGTNAVGPIADFPCGGRRQLAHNVYLNFRICNRRLQVDWSPRGGWTAAWDECGGTAAWDRRGNGSRGTGGELSRTSRVSRVADSSCRSCLQSTFRSLWCIQCCGPLSAQLSILRICTPGTVDRATIESVDFFDITDRIPLT